MNESSDGKRGSGAEVSRFVVGVRARACVLWIWMRIWADTVIFLGTGWCHLVSGCSLENSSVCNRVRSGANKRMPFTINLSLSFPDVLDTSRLSFKVSFLNDSLQFTDATSNSLEYSCRRCGVLNWGWDFLRCVLSAFYFRKIAEDTLWLRTFSRIFSPDYISSNLSKQLNVLWLFKHQCHLPERVICCYFRDVLDVHFHKGQINRNAGVFSTVISYFYFYIYI